MNIDKDLICPKCKGKEFEIKREATYVYTYKINTPHMTNLTENEDGLPFLFDNREKTSSREFLLCLRCGEIYPCSLDANGEKVDFTIVQKAIRADHEINPGFLG